MLVLFAIRFSGPAYRVPWGGCPGCQSDYSCGKVSHSLGVSATLRAVGGSWTLCQAYWRGDKGWSPNGSLAGGGCVSLMGV